MEKVIIGVSGVRGIVGQGLSPKDVLEMSAGFGKICEGGNVLVGGDTRTSGDMLRYAAISGLLWTGSDATDAGVCPTPTIQLAVKDGDFQGGIAVTASHNPPEWNGLKFIGPDGIFLSPIDSIGDKEKGRRLADLFQKYQVPPPDWEKVGHVKAASCFIKEHIYKILSLDLVDVQKIRERRFKVAIDCCNGAGSLISPLLLRHLGCEVIELNSKPDGIFLHDPEPVPESLGQLSTAVGEYGADLGFANDPDADRLSIVSEKGEAIGEEYTLALCVKFVLTKKKGPVVANLSTSRMLDDIAAELGTKVHRSAVGELNVAKKMQTVDAVVGGEGNGGVMLPALHLGRDAPLGTALILSYLAQSEKTLSDLASSIPKYVMLKQKLDLGTKEPSEALHLVKQIYSKEHMDHTDGVKVMGPDWWLHVRASNTEPVLRLISEAPQRKKAELLCKSIKDRLRKLR